GESIRRYPWGSEFAEPPSLGRCRTGGCGVRLLLPPRSWNQEKPPTTRVLSEGCRPWRPPSERPATSSTTRIRADHSAQPRDGDCRAPVSVGRWRRRPTVAGPGSCRRCKVAGEDAPSLPRLPCAGRLLSDRQGWLAQQTGGHPVVPSALHSVPP